MTYQNEIWAPISGYEDYYEVSNKGRVKSLERYVKFRGDTMRRVPEKLKSLREDVHGYYDVGLSKDGKERIFKVHRLVAQAFIPNSDKNRWQINHKDGNKKNNYVDNLEWVTPSENMIHGYKLGLQYNKPEHMKNMVKNSIKSRSIPVMCVTTGKYYTCIKEAAIDTNMDWTSVKYSIDHDQPAKGFKFCYVKKS